MSNVYLVTIKEIGIDKATARVTAVQHPVFDFHENIPLQILLESYAYLSYGGTYFDPKPFKTKTEYDDLIQQHPFRKEYEKWGLLHHGQTEESLCELAEELIEIVSYNYEKVESGATPSYCDLTFKVLDDRMLFHLQENLHWGSAMYDAK